MVLQTFYSYRVKESHKWKFFFFKYSVEDMRLVDFSRVETSLLLQKLHDVILIFGVSDLLTYFKNIHLIIIRMLG